ncbi:MAG: helix-turn-helix transcriptional regulator, partial [Erysipelotrichaceae bacterium]|nr:helix-turn-helix transcriptional regulator [Erysipelotrichaceae bacterium]
MEIGQRIKQLRMRNDLTLEELASRCELTKGFLSQLENDIASPSIQTLSDIVEALGTNLSKFFQEDTNEKVVFQQDDFFVDEKEGVITTWVIPNAQKNEMEPIILQL